MFADRLKSLREEKGLTHGYGSTSAPLILLTYPLLICSFRIS
jgi:hypothetical protein